MKALIKLGGTLLETAESRERLGRELAGAAAAGWNPVVVHGGGKQMTRFLSERGIESKFINGLRVTTPEVIDGVLCVFAGSVNKHLVSSLTRAGVRAVGISGVDGLLTEAEPWSPELGAVGRPVRSHPELLNVLTGAGFVPVVACVAADRAGSIYNVNADQMAASCAAAYGARKLLFLTDVEGVRVAGGEVAPVLDPAACRSLIEGGVATGGMQAKLEAALGALENGVSEVVVAHGHSEGIIGRLLGDSKEGTRLASGGAVLRA